jgi:predicted MPP superfamily phosphohydrolase
MSKLITVFLFIVFFVLTDIYVFQAIKEAFKKSRSGIKKTIYIVHWAISLLSVAGLLIYNFAIPAVVANSYRSYIIVALFITYLSKIFGVFFLLLDDLYRLMRWLWMKISDPSPTKQPGKSKGITRSEFLSKAALISVTAPFITMSYGIISGAHNYRIRRKTVSLPNLPSAFDGLRVGQLSDIHSGSFYNKTAVTGGVDLLMAEKPDIVFFTGDLVNTEASEVNNYIDVFNKVKAPLGVFSTLGNHDYGDYRSWPSDAAKRQNLDNIIKAHKVMDWDILLNENRTIRIDGEEIVVIGVENWGAGRFSKYGDLKKAYEGTEDKPLKILLSHDPSHWDAEVRPQFSDIDLTLSGHTHGFQFGVEIGNIKWSPSQYIYKQWAGLYQEDDQYIYVNRGFGFIGYPGRIGILPEITILELKKA